MKKLVLILKSLFSNQAVLDLRKTKWYITLIVFVLTIFLPWIPYLSSGYTANTASLLTATSNCEVDKGFKQMLSEDYFKNIKVSKDANGKWAFDYSDLDTYADSATTWDNEYSGANTKALFKSTYANNKTSSTAAHMSPSDYISSTNYTNDNLEYYFDNIAVEGNLVDTTAITSSTSSSSTAYETTGRITYLEAYFIPSLSSTDANYTLLANNFVYSVIFGVTATGTFTYYPHSYVIFTKDTIILGVYSIKSSLSNTSASGSYTGVIADGFNAATPTAGETINDYLTRDNFTGNVNELYNDRFCTFMHEAGRQAYIASTWMNVLIISCVTLGTMLVAFIALLVINKRKTSIYRDTKVWEDITEAVYLTLCPSLITMVVTFFSSSYTMIMMIGCVLMRVVFIINRICPPPEQSGSDANKPLYQARS